MTARRPAPKRTASRGGRSAAAPMPARSSAAKRTAPKPSSARKAARPATDRKTVPARIAAAPADMRLASSARAIARIDPQWRAVEVPAVPTPPGSAPQVSPMVFAVMAALPVAVHSQSKVPVLPPVAANALPQQAAQWQAAGTGSTWAVNGNNAVLNQPSQRGVYNWQSYNIGANASVTYQFNQAGSAALNRVVGGDPSQILGTLRSTVPGADGKPVTGGTVLLINPNGVLFGAGARVDTGSLIASSLNVKDSDFLSGFNNSIASTEPTFLHEGGAELFVDAKSFVRVEQGAEIKTATGGQVFLFAKNVENAGSISTPGGQVILAAGEKAYLQDPGAEKLYASEANENIPALRGLLVEVGGQAGRVLNTGHIDVGHGNATLVGMAVNQNGRISATTSVTENGSVFLLARGGAAPKFAYEKHATQGGELMLGQGSRIEITPDTTPGSDGKPLTIDGNTTFTKSRIELAGQTVVLENDAAIVAPSANVNVRAEVTPNYDPLYKTAPNLERADAARIVMGAGATIDVSGTEGARVDGARNFVTTEILGGADLADAPSQRNGVLYRQKVTYDVRAGAPILSTNSLKGYANTIRRDATELMSTGGQVNLTSSGAVVTHRDSMIDVSGGKVTYSDAQVNPTVLVAADGTRYTLDQAPKDLQYVAIEGGKTTAADPYGLHTGFRPQNARTTPGYEEGRNAGSVSVLTQTAVLDGRLKGDVTTGARQASGIDTAAVRAVLELGRQQVGLGQSATLFGSSAFGDSAQLTALRVGADTPAADDGFWADARNAVLPAEGRISAATLNASGFGTVRISSREAITIDKGADLHLPDLGALELRASGDGGVTLGGNITARGGSVLAQTANAVAGQQGGDVVLGEDSTIDVSGTFVNRYLDGATVAPALAGGSVRLLSAHALDLESNTRIDVSGGATVSTSGSTSGTAAGGIELESNRATLTSSDAVSDLRLSGATLRGWSLTKGGSLRIRATGVDIAADDGSPPLMEGAEPGQLRLTSAFFGQGGFGGYDIEGGAYLRIGGVPGGDDTREESAPFTLAPRQLNWVADAATRQAASGTAMASVFKQTLLLPDAQRRATHLTLSASGLLGQPNGDLTLDPGAHIDADAGASVALSANRTLDVAGDITARGGKVALALKGNGTADTLGSQYGYAGTFHIGPDAVIDVSGIALRDLTTNGLQTGRVLDGGAITLSVTDVQSAGRQTRIVVDDGAVLRADGARDTLDVSVLTNAGTQVRREEVASAGGAFTVNANDGGAALGGTWSARSGGGTATGGSLTITQPDKLKEAANRVVEEHRIELAATLPETPGGLGVVQMGADTINAGGFADVALTSTQRIHVGGDVALATGRSITLTAETLTADAGALLSLTAPTAITLNGTVQDSGTPYAASTGDAAMTLRTGQLRLGGRMTLQGFDEVHAQATDSVRIDAINRLDRDAQDRPVLPTGGLYTAADLTFDAPQTAVSTLVSYTLSAPGRTIRFTGGDRNSAAPVAAGGQLTVEAAHIVQDGVLRAPLGRITFNATDSVTLTERSLTSVSGAGLTVPVGGTADGKDWAYAGTALEALPEKAVQLLAPGQRVSVADGAVIDASGGGTVQAVEFVPGPGGSQDAFIGPTGSFAIVPTVGGYAPNDLHIAKLTDTGNKAAAPIAAGQTITFGAGAAVPAGTYAVLPARYALQPGAFLITPSGSARMALGTVQARGDGTQLVAAQLGSTGTAYATATTGFIVRTSAQVRQLSEMALTDVDSLVAQTAQSNGSAVPRLAQDAGQLDIAAAQLVLQGHVLLKKAEQSIDELDARGGGVAIVADRIRVGNQPATEEGVLALDAAMLNALGADSLTLGALRKGTAATGRQLDVMAREVVVDTASQALQAGDVVLAATEDVKVTAKAQVQATGNAVAEQLAVQGDGALLRVSADAGATSVRTGAARTQGRLDIGEGSRLQGGAITAEATAVNAIASSADLQAQAFTVGAARIAVGSEAVLSAAGLGADTLAVTGTLAQRLAAAERTTLRSFDSIDFHGASTLGGDQLGQLTLDAPVLRALGASADVRAGSVLLTNTSGGSADAAAGSAAVTLTATTGDATIGPGAVAVQGAAQTSIKAARSIVLDGGDATGTNSTTRLAVGGDLLLQANSLTATQRTEAQLDATGRIVVAGNTTSSSTDDSPRAAGGNGANVAMNAQQIEQGGRIDLASGSLTLRATGEQTVGLGQAAIEFMEGSVTNLAGKAYTFDGQTVATAGGSLMATAAQGNLVLADGSRIDVSAGGKGAQAGDVTLSAVQGSATVDGTLLATSDAAQPKGGRLALDTRDAFNLAQLGDQLQTDVPDGQRNFAELISMRNRQGDQVLEAGTTLKAQRIEIEADAGSLAVAGTLDASGAQGGRVVLSAGQDLKVADGARLLAHATADGRDGGRVALASTSGQVALQRGAVVDTHGQAGGLDGKLTVRALRDVSDVGNDVKVDPIAATLIGVRAVEVEGYQVYNATTIGTTQQQAYQAEAAGWFGTDGSAAAAMRERLAGGDAALADKLGVRAGIEVRSAGNLTLGTAWNLSGAGVAGAPLNVTLRAAGNLTVSASLSDGFATTTPTGAITGPGGDLRLVAGADLAAAQLDRTVAHEATGDVVIGRVSNDVLVRTSTGDIDIAAGRDVTLLNQRAAVYTTGLPVAADGLPGYAAPTNVNAYVQRDQALLLAGGGSVGVQAGRDVNGAADAAQNGVDWQWRGFNGHALSWWSRYDKFRQGFGTLGGGDVAVQAGRDAVRVHLAAAENAYVPDAADGVATEHTVSNGSASLIARRDVLGGFVMAGGDSLSVRAGRNLSTDAAGRLLKVLHDNTAVDLSATGSLEVASVGATLLRAPVTQWSQANREFAYGQRIAGTAPDASLRMVSDAGDVRLAGVDGDAASQVTPSQLVVAAPEGSASVGMTGPVVLAPAEQATVLLASRDDVSVGGLIVRGQVAEQASPQIIGSDGARIVASPISAVALPQLGTAEPVRVISTAGDVSLNTVAVAAPLRVMAAGDISAQKVDVMHTQATDLSLAQAGGNISVDGQGNGWTVHGPGDQVVLAGGDVTLGTSGGFVAVGNRQVQALPGKSADLTVLAGVDPAIGDYVQARQRYFHLLGGGGIDSHAGDLAAQLKALANNEPLPVPGSPEAKTFAALRPDEQLAEARALAGDAAYQATVLAWMRARTGDAKLDAAGALAKLSSLDATAKGELAGRVLGDAWLARTTPEQQLTTVLALADAAAGAYIADLAAFVTVRTGGKPADTAEALARYAALPIEQQLLHMNRVLKAELKASGRAASALSGDERDAAYARGYLALATVFPGLGKAKAGVDMGSSQIKTQQDSDITVLAPRGGANVGQISGSTLDKPASELGVVTTGGGGIFMAVRDDVAVNQSRVFTVADGDILMWASLGNIDAGKGAKTVTGAPPPVYRLVNGQVVVDTSGSFSGSGIAVLNADSDLDLYAPRGEINAGDAGIKSAGNAYFGAVRFVGADNLQVSGATSGGPAPTPPASPGSLALAPAATSAGQRAASNEDDEEERRKRAKRRNLLLDFLGFGEGERT